MTVWHWKAEGKSLIRAWTKCGEFTVEERKGRKPKFLTHRDERLVAISDSEEQAILAAKDEFQRVRREGV